MKFALAVIGSGLLLVGCGQEAAKKLLPMDVKSLKKLAEQGDVNAQYNLGVMYNNGTGVEQNFKEAVKWYRKAAEQGQVYAQSNLGVIYAKGQGVDQDFKEALKWWQKAADQGNAYAQYNLGRMYKRGEGVTEDHVTAYAWWNIAATNGDKDANGNKRLIAEDMTSNQIAKAEVLSKEMLKKNPKLLKKKE